MQQWVPYCKGGSMTLCEQILLERSRSCGMSSLLPPEMCTGGVAHPYKVLDNESLCWPLPSVYAPLIHRSLEQTVALHAIYYSSVPSRYHMFHIDQKPRHQIHVQWNLSIEDTMHWDPAGCPVYSGTSL